MTVIIFRFISPRSVNPTHLSSYLHLHHNSTPSQLSHGETAESTPYIIEPNAELGLVLKSNKMTLISTTFS